MSWSDKHERKAELRLDISEGLDGAYREKDGIFALKPGSLDDSELWHRIISEDSEEVMPPPEANKKLLTVQEKELIKEWISSGAKYEKVWAFEKPKKPDLPKVKNGKWSDEPIDLFVMKKLESTGVTPSPEADKKNSDKKTESRSYRSTSKQRGVRKFDTDTAGAYEQLVDKLLSREQYGEHMARYWLDLVRFADTNGMHKDYYREFGNTTEIQVIRAYNENLRYDEFVRYQLAR